MISIHETLLEEVLSLPSAPFRESHIIGLMKRRLGAAKVPHFQDPVGNIVIGFESAAAYRRELKKASKNPLLLFVAHMDHPGFHGVKWKSEAELEFAWHGGSPTADLIGATVWLAADSGYVGKGEITEVVMHSSGRFIESGVIRVSPEVRAACPKAPKAKDLFGGMGFRAPVWREGDLLYTKAADDLVGSFAILTLALSAWKRPPKRGAPPPFAALLTRAEEVGFIGAIGHFELGWLTKNRRQVLCVSLETSRTLPGAEIGKGPVVRLGDRSTVFDAGALRVFSDLAEKVLPGSHQRRIMDGGSCEATAATAYGLKSIGISVPLGNYHNQCFEGGPDARGPLGPAPEFVHLQDVRGLVTLCQALISPKVSWEAPWAAKTADFKKSLKRYKALL